MSRTVVWCAAVAAAVVCAGLAPQEVEPVRLPAAAGPGVIRSLPFTARAPGTYTLASDVHMPSRPRGDSSTGIVVAADDVVIDLGGHALVGSEGSSHGIAVALPERPRVEPFARLVVRGGTVRGWGGHGIDARRAAGARIEDVELARNGVPDEAFGGLLTGAHSRVLRCGATSNAWAGITAGAGSIVTACTAASNGAHGFGLADGAIARDCTATGNEGGGFLLVGAAISVDGCTATDNGGSGFAVAGASLLRHSTAAGNGVHGFALDGGAVVADSLAASNGHAGVSAGAGSRVDGNHVAFNPYGIAVGGHRAVVAGTTAHENGAALLDHPGGGALGAFHDHDDFLDPEARSGQDRHRADSPPAWSNVEY